MTTFTTTISLASRRFVTRQWPYLLLTAIFGVTLVAMVAAGLNLGYYSDILNFEYRLDRLGIRDGINWIFRSDGRHLLSGVYEAALHIAFPWQSAAAYATSLLFYFGVALFVLLLADTLLRGKYRWISFSVALVYAFNIRRAEIHFTQPNSGFDKLSLIFDLLSILCYLYYVRNRRQSPLLRELSILFYVLSIFLYEATALFFLLNPLIAWIEDRRNNGIPDKKAWLAQAIRDSLAYPVLLFGYIVILYIVVPKDGAASVSFSVERLIQQVFGGLLIEFSPGPFLDAVRQTLQGNWLLLTLAVASLTFIVLWFWSWRNPDEKPDRAYAEVLAVGGAAIALNLIGVAPGNRPTDLWEAFNYLTYSSLIGITLILCFVGALLLNRLPSAVIRRVVFGLIIAFFVSTGFTHLFQIQQNQLQLATSYATVQASILHTVPSLQGNQSPYFLLITDQNPDQLGLNAEDIRFPIVFDVLYHKDDILADAVYNSAQLSDPPPTADVPTKLYGGRYIIVDSDGIYSPLQPRIPIDPSRLVVLSYESTTHLVRVLDQVPPDVIAHGNLVMRAQTPLKTNYSLITLAKPPA